MKVNIEVDLEDFTDLYVYESLTKELNEYVKAEVMRLVKKDPKYKAFINKKALEVLDNLEI
jgi:hypothetical protein